MTADKLTNLVPKLRFPEFRDADEWDEIAFGDLGNFIGGGTPSTDNQSYWSGTIPWISSSDISEESIHKIRVSRFISKEAVDKSATKIVPEGSILLVSRVGVGKLAVSRHATCTSQDFTNFIPREANAIFLAYCLKSRNKTLFRYCQGSTISGFTSEDISLMKIPFPHAAEQQKIADCLGSLDDLIAAEGRKLEALRQHKQGLMQQLFPQPGETVPRLRFPEFRNTPKWEEKELGDVSEVLMCKRIFASQTNPNGGVPFYKIGTLGGKPDAFISKDLFEEYKSKYNFPRLGEILITCSGTVGKCLTYDGSEAYFQDSNIVWIDNPTLEVSNQFLLCILSNVNWSTLSSTTITRIYGPDLRGLTIKFPQNKQEQKRIATCLSSLEDVLAVQAQKIDALRQQKQGLLQQLFPSPETV